MSQSPEALERSALEGLVPPNALNRENFQALLRHATRTQLNAGEMVFREGDLDRTVVYLLSGELELVSGEKIESVVRGGSEEAAFPLANQHPRQLSARAKTVVTVARVDSDLLDILLTWDQLSAMEVSGITVEEDAQHDDDGDWMNRILQANALMRIPPANIQALFMRLQERPARAGEQIVRQGEKGDYYYIISQGSCDVSRTLESGAVVNIATLSDGDAFGEEALLAEATRNATVTMRTDGVLMRLAKADFDELLKAPVLAEVTLEQTRAMVKEGAAMLDVRLDSEFASGTIKGSENIPLFAVRMRAKSLDAGRKYICICETGRRSSAAAFLLHERGFDSYVLRGGLQSLPKAEARA